jgi:cytochrome c oxidase subunit 2
MRLSRNGVVFILIAAIAALISGTFYLLTFLDLRQRNAPERAGALVTGVPLDFELDFQTPFSPFDQDIRGLNHFLLAENLIICALVGTLSSYVIWRYRRSKNSVPSAATRNTALEVLWTLVPAMTLIVIGIPSFRLLHVYNFLPPTEMVLKVTGHQWYWEYQYPDNGNIDIQSVIVPDNQLAPKDKDKRLFVADQYAVVPIKTAIRIQVTGADVIHSFFVPSLGVQKYAVPGRLNEAWTRIEREGVYYGQCNQICGINHAFMPIAIRAVSKDEFDGWVRKQLKIASGGTEQPSPPKPAAPPAAQPEVAAKPAGKQTISGTRALALASLIAQCSPLLHKTEKKVAADLLEAKRNVEYPVNKKINVEVSSILCRASSTPAVSQMCNVQFGEKIVTIKGRKAHELFATLAEAGVAPSEAAGGVSESMSNLTCEIDPLEIQRAGGSGAQCEFEGRAN